MIIDKNHKLIGWNKAMEKLSTMEAKKMIGKTTRQASKIFYGEEKDFLMDFAFQLEQIVDEQYLYFERKEEILTATIYVPFPEGEGTYLWARASPLFNAKGEIIGAIETLRDITEQKASERELKNRIRELNCLYEIIKLIKHPLLTVDELLSGIIDVIAEGFQYPELISAQISLGDLKIKTPNFQKTPWGISTKMNVSNKVLRIETYYVEEKEFIEEEETLIKKIIEQVHAILDLKLAHIY